MNRNAFYDNLREYNENSLTHASALYGTKRANTKYYKREGQPGNYKYYYTKEEWDAAHSNGNSANNVNTENSQVQNSSSNNQNRGNNQNNDTKQTANNDTKVVYDAAKQAEKYDRAKNEKKYDKSFVKVAKYMDNLDTDKCLEEYKKYLADPKNYPQQAIYNMLDEYGKGGNVNLNNRPEINAQDLKDNDYEDAGEGYATVFSGVYSNEAGDKAYNFTPIMVDPKTGEYLGVMPKDEFENYCWDVVDGIRPDDKNLQIGGAFEGENAVQDAIDRGKKIHNLHEELHNMKGK